MCQYVNIADIVAANMCVGCGTCEGVCPNKSIKMAISNKHGHYIPSTSNNCTKCSICLEVCPAIDRILNYADFVNNTNNEKQIDIGNYLNCYHGYAHSDLVRSKASSGGLIPAILNHLLNQGMIDGALVVRTKKENPLEFESFIARSSNEILEATGSKYYPVATNVMLRYILDNPGKYAVVGLPCQIQAIRKVESKFKRVKSRVLLTLGLFCNHTPSFMATQYLLKQMRVDPNDLIKLNYRSGWDNCALIQLGNGETIKYKAYWYLGFGSLFRPTSCSICNDHTCEQADISFGDAWLPGVDRNNLGESIAVIRSDIGQKVISSAIESGAVILKHIDECKVFESQKQPIIEKKRWVKGRIYLSSRLGIITLQDKPYKKLGLKQIYRASMFLGKQSLGNKKILWKVISSYYLIASNIFIMLRDARRKATNRIIVRKEHDSR